METDNKMAMKLAKLSVKMLDKAYAPYSGFYVGAAMLAGSGKIYTGANIENASYPAGTCAERSAISHAASEGERKIEAIAIAGGRGGDNREFTYPCGICRQVMREFSDPKTMKVILSRKKENGRLELKIYTLEELLPGGFGPENLGNGDGSFFA
ncbi:MAG: cytidine deaminase [Clostridia bacterium]|nr:cytidine deaminase [Clostridia bacterium]